MLDAWSVCGIAANSSPSDDATNATAHKRFVVFNNPLVFIANPPFLHAYYFIYITKATFQYKEAFSSK